jgi:hypothetical protein
MTHDPMCEKYAIASSRDCWACKAIADARADEREKAALRIEALADREERESLMTWGQHFVHLGAFEACAKLVRGGEQE